MIRRWKNVLGGLCVVLKAPGAECGWANENGDEFPQAMQDVLGDLIPDAGYYDGNVYELDMSFLSSGYDDPGRTYGEPEDCYPPESEDERVLNYLALWVEKDPYPIPEEAWHEFENWYCDDIFQVEIDTEGRSWED